MDEQQALLVIESALMLARNYYESLLLDKLSNSKNYKTTIGLHDLNLAIAKVSRRIEQIEDQLEQDEGE
jgi:hypothetical protein